MASEKHIQWLRSIPYPAYLQTPHWREVRIDAIERSQLRCGHCGKTVSHPSELDVHHKGNRYERRGREGPADAVAICRPCHHSLHPTWNDDRLTRDEWIQRRDTARAAVRDSQYTDDGNFVEEPPDVREHDALFRYVCRELLGREPTRANKRELLSKLRDRRGFLIDVSEMPWRGGRHADYVPALIERCRELGPRRIVLIKAPVFDAAFRPLVQAGLPVVDVRIPFPTSGRQREFQEAFNRALSAVYAGDI
jgi:hypothetical protein